MNTSSMMNDINHRVTKAITSDMTIHERKALRKKITIEVIEERAKIAGVDPQHVLTCWNLAIKMGHSVETIEHQFGL